MDVGGTEKSWAELEQPLGGTRVSVTECIVISQAHDTNIYVKSKRLKHTLSLDTLIIIRKKQYVNLRE